MTSEQNERMTAEQIDAVLLAASVDGSGCKCFARSSGECACEVVWFSDEKHRAVHAITQLQADLAAATKRAEKAVELGNAQTEYTNRVLAERGTLRTENAALRDALGRLSNYDTTTQEGVMLQEIARDTLARITKQEGVRKYKTNPPPAEWYDEPSPFHPQEGEPQ